MIGGMPVCFMTAVWFPGVGPLIGMMGACAIAFVLGADFERLMLIPMCHGKIDRPVEFGTLVTFGLGSLPGAFPGGTMGGMVEAAATGLPLVLVLEGGYVSNALGGNLPAFLTGI